MIGHKGEQAVTVRALRGAAPYIHMYKGKVFVIKTGGGAFRDVATMRAFMEQVAILHHLGIRVVLVHGGGPQLDEVTKKMGVETRMVQGRRVTDASAIDATVTFAPPFTFSTAFTVLPRMNEMPCFSKAFWAAFETSSSSTGRMRSCISTTVTLVPKAL